MPSSARSQLLNALATSAMKTATAPGQPRLCFVARHCLTAEKLDFILNHDLKYPRARHPKYEQDQSPRHRSG